MNSWKYLQLSHGLKIAVCSFDIVSLFTTIPINETIQIVTNEIYKDDNTFRKMNRNKFSSMLEVLSKDTLYLKQRTKHATEQSCHW